MKFKTALVLLLMGMSCPPLLKAQTWELGLGGGAAGYTGDLNPDQPLKFSGMAAGSYVKVNFNGYWAVGLHYNYGRIAANDAKSSNADFQQRNLRFYSPLHELTAQVDFNFMEYFNGGGPKNFTPYVYAGVGGVLFNPSIKLDGNVYHLRRYRTEDQYRPYRNYALSIPYGAGVKVKLGERLGIFSQIGFRTVFSDYLDDVSGAYRRITDGDPLRTYLANPALNDRSYGSQRGDSRKKDGYMFAQVGISYSILCRDCLTF